MILLAILALVLLGGAIGLAAWAFVLPRSRTAVRLQEIEAYGFAPAAPAAAAFGESEEPAALTNLARRLGDIVGRYMGGVSEEHIRKHLVAAGMYETSPRTVLGYRLLSCVLFGVLGLALNVLPGIVGHIGVAVLVAYIGWRVPIILIERRAKRRTNEIDLKLPDVIDQIVITLEAGVGFGGSMQLAAEQLGGPLGVELRLTLQEQRMGLGMRSALKNLLERVDTPNVRTFVRAVVQGDALGVSIGTVMRNLAIEMRKTRRQQAEERAQRAPVKLLFPLVFLIFPSLGVVLLGPAIIEITKVLGS
ncbi:MAG TPA: type II secretion system F family protein [Solirubrobacteraceae bacterium]|nr:type II secretion system F family protein [Solirubrobacteraceae bacterium]